MKIKSTLLALLSLFTLNSAWAVIYGSDDRKDLYEINDPEILEQAQSTLTFTLNGLILKRPDGDWNISQNSLGNILNLCPEVRFREQPAAGACSATLVSPKHVLTAGHCMPSQARCEEIYLMSNYHVNRQGEFPQIAESKNVYRCKKLLVREQAKGQDFALFELDREVSDATPARLGYKVPVKKHDRVRMIGYPDGLPSKVVSDIKVLRTKKDMYYTNADAFKGNSGSGIFSQTTGEMVGILYGGNNDYRTHHIRQCREVLVWTERQVRRDGETVTQISAIWPKLAPFLKDYVD